MTEQPPSAPPLTLLSAFASQFNKDLAGFDAKTKEAEERITQLRAQIAELEKQLVALAGGRTYCEYCLAETRRLEAEAKTGQVAASDSRGPGETGTIA